MKKSPLIQLKAAFLLIMFSLNTIVGFACSVGLDMGFNSSHHQEEKTVIAHKGAYKHSDLLHEDKDMADNHHSSQKSKDNCCNDEAAKFAKVDKLTPQSFDFNIHPVFFTALLSTFYHDDVFPLNSHTPDNKYFVRSHHPPIPDIRKAIQSFQI